jgi:Fe-S-cluster-containing dehydrogenase component
MPTRALEPGEQYRFHFDMGKCIGCKCCVVACNEQNGNPAEINWRRVATSKAAFFRRSRRTTVDGLQPLPRADVPAGLPG